MVVGFEGFVGYKRIGGESSRRTFLLEMIFNVLYFGKISYDYNFEIFVEIVNNSLFFLVHSTIRINKRSTFESCRILFSNKERFSTN